MKKFLSNTNRKYLLAFFVILLASSLTIGLLSREKVVTADTTPLIGLSQFKTLWEHADKPVQDGKVSRSWTWGPSVSGILTEPYTQGGTRQVQYFDKSRMEQTEGRPVSNGLLAKEMVTGLLQLGDNDFRQYPPNKVTNIAGDQIGNTVNPTYASFRNVITLFNTNLATDKTGQFITATLDGNGVVGDKAELATKYKLKNVLFEGTFSHNIPDVFIGFLRQSGLIYDKNGFVQSGGEPVFNWILTVGLPLSEPYWTRCLLGGVEQDILVQVYERRVLTYTPANPAAYQVEMGNVGQHYYAWRNIVINSTVVPNPPTATATATAPQPTPTQGLAQQPVWSDPLEVGPQQLWRPALRVRPNDGTAYIVGETGSGSATAPADVLFLARSSNPAITTNINDTTANNNRFPHIAFEPDGTGYIVWRHQPRGYVAYLRKILPDGTLLKGVDIGGLIAQSGAGADLDQPDIIYSPKSKKLYITGQVQTNPPGWGFIESSDGGNTFSNFVLLAANRPKDSFDVKPRVCVDKNDNVHVVAQWDQDVYARSRIDGVWGPMTRLADHSATDYLFRNFLTIACSNDGYAYAAYQSPHPSHTQSSTGLARYTPGIGWKNLSYDIFGPIAANNNGIGIVVTPDNRVWVAAGINGGAYSGTTVVVSQDRGQSFQLSGTAIAHVPDNQFVDMDFSTYDNRLHVVGTFKEPGPRATFYTSAR